MSKMLKYLGRTPTARGSGSSEYRVRGDADAVVAIASPPSVGRPSALLPRECRARSLALTLLLLTPIRHFRIDLQEREAEAIGGFDAKIRVRSGRSPIGVLISRSAAPRLDLDRSSGDSLFWSSSPPPARRFAGLRFQRPRPKTSKKSLKRLVSSSRREEAGVVDTDASVGNDGSTARLISKTRETMVPSPPSLVGDAGKKVLPEVERTGKGVGHQRRVTVDARANGVEPTSIVIGAGTLEGNSKVISHVPNGFKLEHVAAGWPSWLTNVAGEAVKGWLPRRADSFEKLHKVKCYMQQLLHGLEHCHIKGVLHRDIKGANLLIDNNGILKIADFGLATIYNPDNKQHLTCRVVTLWYRPPELLLGATEYGVAVDLWSTGCILAELLSGRPIMPGRTEVPFVTFVAFVTLIRLELEPSSLARFFSRATRQNVSPRGEKSSRRPVGVHCERLFKQQWLS
ncbi:hypothetical protein GW17_00022121 [Ensete ventricosum]|nr:hypothetical protein GW17_00022121 [Ensete ventricosum]